MNQSQKIGFPWVWPAAPTGFRWLKPAERIAPGDHYSRIGVVHPVGSDEMGCIAGAPVVFALGHEAGGFCHYVRPWKNDPTPVASKTLTFAQRRRLKSRAADLFFLLELIESGGFIVGTSYSRRVREHASFILNGRDT